MPRTYTRKYGAFLFALTLWTSRPKSYKLKAESSTMISLIRGKIIYLSEAVAVLENAGIGYEISVPAPVRANLKLGELVSLWTHEHIREDARDLYGFINPEELSFFKKLISISGVGPKMALKIFELGKIDEIKKAVLTGRAEFLSEASGVGSKTAQKIILELRGKIDLSENEGSDDVLDALLHLGYSRNVARSTLGKLSAGLVSSEERIREALKILGKR